MLVAAEYGNVTQIRLSRYPDNPGGTVSVYFVDGLLIDSGPAYTVEELAEFLKDKLVKTVVNTHHHEDHIAANALLKERYGVELFAHPLAVDKINQPATLYPYQEEVWGYPIPSQVNAIGDSVSTRHFCFEVIYTPGHDRDHICLFEPGNGWLFSGDLFVGTHPNVVRPQDDITQIITDLKKVRALKPTALFPAPGKVITDPVSLLEQTIQYLEELGHKVVEFHEKGLAPVEVVKQIFGHEAPLAEFTQQQFSSLNLVKSYLKAVNRNVSQGS
jgi:glyoxylase-like metal-dependent hydrolase (beta-lactamase superfamily II)